MSEESPERTGRLVSGVQKNYDIVDIAKDTGQVHNVEAFAIDAENEELALVYQNGEAEIIPFDEFEDGEIGIMLSPTILGGAEE